MVTMGILEMFKEYLESKGKYEGGVSRVYGNGFKLVQVFGMNVDMCFFESDEYPPRWVCENNQKVTLYDDYGRFMVIYRNKVIIDLDEQHVGGYVEGDVFYIVDKRTGERIMIR